MNINKVVNNWNQELKQLQGVLEGPTVLRAASALAGLTLAAGALFTLRHFVYQLADPPSLILKFYTIIFGLVICLNEVKAGNSEALDSGRQWVFKWFPFMSVMAGKGLFMIFVGSMGLGFREELEVLVPAGAVTLVGVAYLITHFAKKGEVDQAIDRSMHLYAQSMYEPLNKA